jgi:glutamine synthetase
VADRGSSIRIPLPVMLKGYGYLEDRRPAANVDPYTVARLLIKTILKS